MLIFNSHYYYFFKLLPATVDLFYYSAFHTTSYSRIRCSEFGGCLANILLHSSLDGVDHLIRLFSFFENSEPSSFFLSSTFHFRSFVSSCPVSSPLPLFRRRSHLNWGAGVFTRWAAVTRSCRLSGHQRSCRGVPHFCEKKGTKMKKDLGETGSRTVDPWHCIIIVSWRVSPLLHNARNSHYYDILKTSGFWEI